MNLSVVGLSVRDAHVFDLFMQRTLGTWRWQHLAASRDADLGEAKLLLLDLAAHGWAQASEVALAQMKVLVGERFVVLLVSAQDRTWAEMPEAHLSKNCVWLAKPYGTEQMRVALTQVAALLQASQVKKPAPTVTRAPQVSSAPPVRPVVSVPTPNPLPLAASLTLTDLASYLEDTPPDRFSLLRQLTQKVLQRQPFELRFTVQNSMIVDPQDAWAATNTPVQVIARVCDSNALASSVTVRELDASEALARAHRLGMPLRDLNEFLFDIASTLLAFRATLATASGPQANAILRTST
jgi:hypothetical protein